VRARSASLRMCSSRARSRSWRCSSI
jgi:hypothetical protein